MEKTDVKQHLEKTCLQITFWWAIADGDIIQLLNFLLQLKKYSTRQNKKRYFDISTPISCRDYSETRKGIWKIFYKLSLHGGQLKIQIFFLFDFDHMFGLEYWSFHIFYRTPDCKNYNITRCVTIHGNKRFLLL